MGEGTGHWPCEVLSWDFCRFVHKRSPIVQKRGIAFGWGKAPTPPKIMLLGARFLPGLVTPPLLNHLKAAQVPM